MFSEAAEEEVAAVAVLVAAVDHQVAAVPVEDGRCVPRHGSLICLDYTKGSVDHNVKVAGG